MSAKAIKLVIAVLAGVLTVYLAASAQSPDKSDAAEHDQLVERGKYLVTLGGCNDCHTPKVMTAQGPTFDMKRMLSGHPADEKLPPFPSGVIGSTGWGAACNNNMTAWIGPWGTSFAANLTPHNLTGCGAWTEASFINAMRSGKHLGAGRDILPPMPWQAMGTLPDDELKAIFAYLKSIPPIDNMVPQPIPPSGH